MIPVKIMFPDNEKKRKEEKKKAIHTFVSYGIMHQRR
jgi:hypothetical protein